LLSCGKPGCVFCATDGWEPSVLGGTALKKLEVVVSPAEVGTPAVVGEFELWSYPTGGYRIAEVTFMVDAALMVLVLDSPPRAAALDPRPRPRATNLVAPPWRGVPRIQPPPVAPRPVPPLHDGMDQESAGDDGRVDEGNGPHTRHVKCVWPRAPALLPSI
jgi:hypothetical protein